MSGITRMFCGISYNIACIFCFTSCSSQQPRSTLYIKPSLTKTVGSGYISATNFSQNGKYFSAVFNDKQIKQWNTIDWHETHDLALTEDCTSPVFSPDGKLVAVKSIKHSNILALWSIASKRRIGIINIGSPIDEKYKLFFIDNNQLIVRTKTGSYLSCQIVSLVQNNDQMIQPQNHSFVKIHRFSMPHNALVYSLNGDDNKITIFDERTDKAIRSFYSPSAIYSAAISQDGNKVVAGGREFGAEVWDFHSGQSLYTVNHPRFLLDDSNQYEMLAVTFSSDSKLLATGDQHGLVQLWNSNTGEKRAVIQAKASTYLTFSPDDKTLVVGNGLKGFQVYNVSSCK